MIQVRKEKQLNISARGSVCFGVDQIVRQKLAFAFDENQAALLEFVAKVS